jgi:glycosyltransferase involved in cell wall biosynthesis
MSEQEKIKVSVCMIAYNQEDFIAEAIESILKQKTSFPVEIVIGDDNSKDKTREICEEYARKFPGKIKFHYREPNLGMMPNFIKTLGECDGKYLAVCEGDDFWTDETKLQRQVDFMEAYPEVSLCCHNHSVLANGEIIHRNEDIEEDTKILEAEDYMRNPFFHTSSYFFRRDAQPAPYPDWYRDVLAGDHFLVLFLSMKGKIGYLNREMSVFRNHSSSVSFTRKALEIKRNFVRHLEIFNEYSAGKYEDELREVIHRWNLIYQVYEPVGYLKKLSYLAQNTGFYLQNFRKVGGIKLLIKYLVPNSVIQQLKS